jgi:hypothetical protein
MKKLFVNNQLVAIEDWKIEIRDEAPKFKVEIRQSEWEEHPFQHDDSYTFFSNHKYINWDNHQLYELLNEEDRITKPEPDKYLYYKIYGYEHSGMCISREPFSCRWDSGLLGVLRLRKDDFEDPEQAVDIYIKTVNQWLSGDVYICVIQNDLDECVDTCSGFYGSDDSTIESMDQVLDFKQYNITKEQVREAFNNIAY